MNLPPLLVRLTLLAVAFLLGELHAFAESAIKKAGPSVVRVLCVYHYPNTGQRELRSTGSGFVIGDDGLIGTNDHVASMRIYKDARLQRSVEQGTIALEFYVGRLTSGGVAEIYPAKVEWQDRGRDLALLRAPDLKAPALKMNIGEVIEADVVYAIGYPGAADTKEDYRAVQAWLAAGRPARTISPPDGLRNFLKYTVNESTIRRPKTDKWSNIYDYPEGPVIQMLENDCNFSPGNSGGPLINIAGEIIGVNSAGSQNLRISSSIVELHRAMGDRWPHKFTTWRPSNVPWYLILGIIGAAVLGITGAVLALSRRQQPEMGRTTLLRILGPTGRRQLGHEGGTHLASPPPPPPPREGTIIDPRAARTALVHPNEKTVLQGRGKTAHQYATFQLSPKEHDGVLLELDAQRFARQNGRLIVGRSTELAHVCLDDRNISNRHAAVRVKGSQLYIEDLESSNGTRVNGKRLEPYTDTPISVGDTISLGSLHFKLRSADS